MELLPAPEGGWETVRERRERERSQVTLGRGGGGDGEGRKGWKGLEGDETVARVIKKMSDATWSQS